ncbi:MAG: amidohydrolase family protein [Sandaracinaceae bacterium]|nr:amidohydrolase family protein [Sandaracinaceae bacterium]
MEWTMGRVTRLAVHLAEGVMGGGSEATDVLREYACYRGRARHSIDLLADSMGRAYGTAVFIHAVGLSRAELSEAHALGAYFVWSPSSNLALYGRTVDIAHLLEIGAVVALGPDWTVSGEPDMLSEMRFAYAYGQMQGIAGLTPERIWKMATIDGARVVDLDRSIGTLEVGKRADIAVFGRLASDPYRAVLESRASDVRLVLIDGLGYYGDLVLEEATAVNGWCEDFDACGVPKFLCVANTPGNPSRAEETYEAIRMQLYRILQDGYPGGMAYGRGDELEEIVRCP